MIPYEIFKNDYGYAIATCRQADMKNVERSLLDKGYLIMNAHITECGKVFIEIMEPDCLP